LIPEHLVAFEKGLWMEGPVEGGALQGEGILSNFYSEVRVTFEKGKIADLEKERGKRKRVGTEEDRRGRKEEGEDKAFVLDQRERLVAAGVL
jgi:hypothetical protein